MRLKKKGNISTKEVTENLDAKLLDLRNKSVSLSGVSVEKCQPTNIKPLTQLPHFKGANSSKVPKHQRCRHIKGADGSKACTATY